MPNKTFKRKNMKSKNKKTLKRSNKRSSNSRNKKMRSNIRKLKRGGGAPIAESKPYDIDDLIFSKVISTVNIIYKDEDIECKIGNSKFEFIYKDKDKDKDEDEDKTEDKVANKAEIIYYKDEQYAELTDFFNYSNILSIIKPDKNKLNKLLFEIFDIINIKLKFNAFLLIDNSHLNLNNCKYPLGTLKKIQSGYTTYNTYGFYSKEYNTIKEANNEIANYEKIKVIIINLDEIIEFIPNLYTEINNKSIFYIINFIVEQCNLAKDTNIEKQLSLLIWYIETNLYKEINNLQPKQQIKKTFIKLKKIYNLVQKPNTMSSFNKEKKQFEMVPINDNTITIKKNTIQNTQNTYTITIT